MPRRRGRVKAGGNWGKSQGLQELRTCGERHEDMFLCFALN